MHSSMRIAIGQFSELDERALRFSRQIGARGVVVNTPDLAGPPWQTEDLLALRLRCEAHELRLESIENLPTSHYLDAMLGGPGRDRCVADYQQTVRNMGAAGIEVLGLNWMPTGVGRTDFGAPVGRGGTRVTVFEGVDWLEGETAFPRSYSDGQLWETFTSFVGDVVPVAEEAGVRIALHPDDPPVPELDGVARIFRTVEALEQATAICPSPSLGIDLCLGTVSEMSGDPLPAIRRLGAAGKIVYVHFRDVQGTVPSFRECFLGDGNYDTAAALRALRDVGFDGFIIDDHAPMFDDDPPDDVGFAYHGHGHATGYLQGLLAAVMTERG
jgi:mannonate dehydratase